MHPSRRLAVSSASASRNRARAILRRSDRDSMRDALYTRLWPCDVHLLEYRDQRRGSVARASLVRCTSLLCGRRRLLLLARHERSKERCIVLTRDPFGRPTKVRRTAKVICPLLPERPLVFREPALLAGKPDRLAERHHGIAVVDLGTLVGGELLVRLRKVDCGVLVQAMELRLLHHEPS